MKYYILLILLSLFSLDSVYSQDELFDFRVETISGEEYAVHVHFYKQMDVKFVEFSLIVEDDVVSFEQAILNKKLDGNYYLFLQGKETLVYLDDFVLPLSTEFTIDSLSKKYVEIKLLDVNFNQIDTYRKEILL